MNLFIIDAIGPFFKGYKKNTVNWSKIPFSHLEDEDGLDGARFKKIHKEFEHFIDTIVQLGYNAISIDDLAHLASFDFYDKKMQSLITEYREEYAVLFEYAKKKGCQIFVNTDVMFFNKHIEKHVSNDLTKINELLAIAVKNLFQDFNIDGLVLRIGETDGIDVKGYFKSKLVIKTPKQANKMIKRLLPIFEEFNKKLIFRNWTVGVYPIGDLMWNEKTFSRAFIGIHSDNFIISLKFGDTDFFDDLKLNPLFDKGPHNKIIELQTRREREGFGEFPYYVGWQYENYYKTLMKTDKVIGVSVWCQSGGWSTWFNRTYLKTSTPWNEMNTRAVIDIYRHGYSADESLHNYFGSREMVDFVHLSYHLMHDILYIEEISARPLYFRRLRIPPLLWFFWDHVLLTPLLLALIHHLGVGKYKIPKKELAEFYEAGQKLNIRNIDYMHDTLIILARCRRTMWKRSIKQKHLDQIKRYQEKYDVPLKFSIHLSQLNYSKAELAFRLLIRQKARYRLLDRVLLSPFVSAAFRFIYRMLKKKLPSFANKQAMSVDMLFK